MRLPCPVKAEQATAEFSDGLLTITLPKAEEAKKHRIPVRAGQIQAKRQQASDKPQPGAQRADTGKQEG